MTSSGVTLGISADYHDSAAALLVDGNLVAAAAEERFTRIKHDPALPRRALAWCLEEAGVGPGDLDSVAFYSKPMTAYERILVSHAKAGPRGVASLAAAVSVWSRSKLWVAYRIESALKDLGLPMPPLQFVEHHRSHAAAAYYPSPYDHAAVLTIDGVGEWTTASIGHGTGKRLKLIDEMSFPDSLGLLYSTVTAHCGFDVNDGEYKLMGLAPFGEPRYAQVLLDEVVHVNDDGSIRLNPRYFAFRTGNRMGHPRLANLLDGPPRRPDQPLGGREADLARSVQVVLEQAVLRMAHHAHEITGESRCCLAGGVALNCVANQRLLEDGPFDEIWVQPGAGDDGGAIGAALWSWHELAQHPRPTRLRDGMSGSFLGPQYDNDTIAAWLDVNEIPFDQYETLQDVSAVAAEAIDEGKVVGWFQGRMEFGPRALGHRSIVADARDPGMVQRINEAVKQREGFRPFAPAVLAESATEWFELSGDLPYMVVTAQVAPERRVSDVADNTTRASDDLAARLAEPRSTIPACTHVDGSARVQTVDREVNPEFHSLLRAFDDRTGCPVLLNTSFNGADEPIVRTPADALRCFEATGLDLLVLERCVVSRLSC